MPAPFVRLSGVHGGMVEGGMMDGIEVIQVTLPGGQTMLARVHGAEGLHGGPRDVSVREPLSFTGVTDTLDQISSAVVGALKQAKPERASIEFGLDLAAKSGKLTGLLVEGDARATLRVKLEWQRTSSTPAALES